MTTPFASMDDAAFEASLETDTDDALSGDEAGGPVQPATTPAGEESAAEDEGQGQENQEGDPNWNPDGPGDLKAALAEARAKEKAIKERADAEAQRAAAYEAELARYRQADAEAQQLRQQQEIQATYEALINEGREDDAVAYLQQVQQQTVTHYQQQAQAGVLTARVEMSEDLARATYSDYDERIARLGEVVGIQEAFRLASQQKNPAVWAYEYSKKVAPTEADLDALVEQRLAQRQAALQDKHKPPTKGHQTIAHVSSGTQAASPDRKPAKRMSDKELEQSLYT